MKDKIIRIFIKNIFLITILIFCSVCDNNTQTENIDEPTSIPTATVVATTQPHLQGGIMYQYLKDRSNDDMLSILQSKVPTLQDYEVFVPGLHEATSIRWQRNITSNGYWFNTKIVIIFECPFSQISAASSLTFDNGQTYGKIIGVLKDNFKKLSTFTTKASISLSGAPGSISNLTYESLINKVLYCIATADYLWYVELDLSAAIGNPFSFVLYYDMLGSQSSEMISVNNTDKYSTYEQMRYSNQLTTIVASNQNRYKITQIAGNYFFKFNCEYLSVEQSGGYVVSYLGKPYFIAQYKFKITNNVLFADIPEWAFTADTIAREFDYVLDNRFSSLPFKPKPGEIGRVIKSRNSNMKRIGNNYERRRIK